MLHPLWLVRQQHGIQDMLTYITLVAKYLMICQLFFFSEKQVRDPSTNCFKIIKPLKPLAESGRILSNPVIFSLFIYLFIYLFYVLVLYFI
jgi:hypothetical protein